MPNEYSSFNQINKVISFISSDSVLKVANKISGENKELVTQLNQKTRHVIKSFWEPLRISYNEASTWLVQGQAENFYASSNSVDQDKGFIFLKDQKNLENRLKEIRDIVLLKKNNGLDFENKDFLGQINSLLEELVASGVSENRWSIINGITNSLFLFFNKNKFGSNKTNLMAKILLIILQNNNLEVEQINFIKKFNKYLNTGANSELDNFIKELDNLQLFKQASRAVCIQEMKEAANSLKKLNYNAIYEINENLGENRYKRIKPRIIDFDDKGVGFTVSLPPKSIDKEHPHAIFNRLKEAKYSDNSITAEINVALKEKKTEINPEELILLEEFKRLGKINLAEIGRSSNRSLVKEYSLEIKNELLYAKLWRKIESIEKSGKIRADKIKKRKFAKKLAINEERKQALKCLLSPIKNEIEKFNTKKNNAVNTTYFNLPHFEVSNNDFLDYISFKDFEKLMSEAKEIFSSIKEITTILNEIDDFSYKLGFDKIYPEYFNQEIINFNKTFNKASIVSFFKNAIQLFEEYKLNPSKVNRVISCKSSNKFEKITFRSQGRLDYFIYSNRLESIIKNGKIEIEAYLNEYLNKDILFNEKIIENKLYRDSSLPKLFFEKIKKFMANFLRNYFVSRKSKVSFLSLLKKNGLDTLAFNSVNDFVLKLKWWHLIFYGINPFCLYKKGFKKKLSEQLFLALIEEDFKKVINSLEGTTHQATRIKCTDELSAIINRLRSLDGSDGDNIGKKSKSRHEIIDELEKDIIKELPEKLFTLKKQANLSLNRFSELSNLSKRAIETLAQAEEARNSDSACLENNFYFFNWLQRQNQQAGTSSKRPFPRQGTS